MRFALIGAGVIGNVHARLIDALPDAATLVAVVDVDADRAHALADPRGAVSYTDTRSLYANEQVDAVAVCLPSALHTDATVEALEAGVHVLIEKPIDITLAAADRVIAAEQAADRVVSVISQRRFQPAPAFLHRAVSTGALGSITSGVTESSFFRGQSYYDSGDWRGTLAVDGGGALMNQGIHALDLLVWLMGEPVTISAHTAQLAHQRIEVEDVAAATIVFQSGAIGSVLASTAAYPGLPVRLALHGDAGSAVIEREELTYFHSRAAEREGDHPEQHQPVTLAEPDGHLSSIDAAHRDQYRDFIAAITDGRPPQVTSRDGRRSLATVLAIYESARTGRPVTLTPEPVR